MEVLGLPAQDSHRWLRAPEVPVCLERAGGMMEQMGQLTATLQLYLFMCSAESRAIRKAELSPLANTSSCSSV